MSCFIVSYPCLLDVYTLIKKYKPELIGSQSENEFINKLSKLNYDSFSCKYNEENTYQYLEYPIKESNRHELTMLFNLCSYMYQCNENPVCYTDFFNELDKYANEIFKVFVEKYLKHAFSNYNQEYSNLRKYRR